VVTARVAVAVCGLVRPSIHLIVAHQVGGHHPSNSKLENTAELA
jgi:hypothetical protein